MLNLPSSLRKQVLVQENQNTQHNKSNHSLCSHNICLNVAVIGLLLLLAFSLPYRRILINSLARGYHFTVVYSFIPFSFVVDASALTP